MSYENIKSFILTILVIVSILLTWVLWTYHPKYDTIENSNSIVKDISIGRTQEIDQLINPTKVIFHKNNQHFGMTKEDDINNIMDEMKKWEFRDISKLSTPFNEEDYLSFTQQNGYVEIIFPDDIPFSIFKSTFHLEDKEISNVSVDRIILNLNANKESDDMIYFVSPIDRLIYTAIVDYDEIQEMTSMYDMVEEYPKYFSYRPTKTNVLYLPIEPTTIKGVQYYTDLLDPEIFKEALFDDPNDVKKHILTYGEEYTDGSRLLRVFSGGKYLQYVNPVNNTDTDHAENSDLIESSIDFINEHGGWTADYRFFSLDQYQQQTTFKLFVRNYPVFNKSGLTEIHQVWGENEIIRYQRPLLILEIPVPSGDVELPEGQRVLEEIQAQPDFNPELVEDIIVGYELTDNPERVNVATLVPIWSVKYNGVWRKLDFEHKDDEIGGNMGGLE